ncbi:MAG TPA: DUF2726 domain-containing protein, partial [Aquirhabdus sp.]
MGISLATTYILIVILSLFFILLLSGSRRRQTEVAKPVRGDDLDVWPFMPRDFMTDAEVRFFRQLKQAVPEFLIFSQVGLSRLIECTDEEDEKFWFNRINRMSVDYVLVDQDAQHVLVAIELDDWSHDHAGRMKADLKKDKALISAGIPMVRFHGE